MLAAFILIVENMRKFAREAAEKYPSIARLNEAISGARRMGSVNTVESYVKGINRFIAFIGVDASYREHWMGHKSGYLDESYFRAEEQNHLAEYRKAIPHLTVYSTPLEEKQMRSRMLVDFAKLQGFNTEELKKLEDILARAKDLDEGIKEFKKFKEESNMPSESNELKTKKSRTAYDGNGKCLVAHNEDEMIQKLHEGFRLVQSLNHDKYLLEVA